MVLKKSTEGSIFRFIPFNIFINEVDINIRSMLQESRQALSIQKKLEHHKEHCDTEV